MRKFIYLVMGIAIALTTPMALKIDITSDAYAANQQGGGAFKKTPKKVKKRTSVKSKKRSRSKKRKIVKKKIRRAPAHNFNGSYSVRMELTSNSTKGLCRSGNKKFRIVNNSTTLKTWALGDTIGGKVSGRRLILFGLKSGVLSDAGNPWTWKGLLLCQRPGVVLVQDL